MANNEEVKPYIKEHDNKTICFADTLVQAKNALTRSNIDEQDKAKLDNAHLMLFGVEEWKTSDMQELKGAMKAATNNFERFEIFGCEMKEEDQIAFGDLLAPDNLNNVKRFDLDNTVLKPKGAHAIFSKVVEVPSIEILNLQGSIGGNADTLAAIADAMVEDASIYKSLYKVDLKINELKADGAEQAAKIVERMQNSDDDGKTEVDLFYNDIGAEGAKSIARALRTSAVTYIDLCCNNIGDEGAKSLAEMLKVNRTLKTLKIALNNIGNEGAIEIFRALAPRPRDKHAKNDVLEVLDISANIMKEMQDTKETQDDIDKKAKINEIHEEIEKLKDEFDTPLPGKEQEIEDKYKEVDAIGLQFEAKPLVNAISRVCTASFLKEFDFTGIELGNSQWDALGAQLSTTTMKALQKRGEPMQIRFSIVDLMNETNLQTLEKYIWGDKNNQSSPYHTHSHIDWRRREDEDKKDN